jgi:hypothetical protein
MLTKPGTENMKGRDHGEDNTALDFKYDVD